MLDTDTYVYGHSTWKDRLTEYNGQSITYDDIGNPLSYRDGMSFVWQAGRQLKSATVNGKTYTYTYNEDGIRTSKTVNGVTTEYIISDGQLIAAVSGNQWLYFIYNESGTIIGFTAYSSGYTYNYYYEFNAQGDVVALLDYSGYVVATYKYDAWGKLLGVYDANGNEITSSGHIGMINPIRYRGYFYDEETGFYYLNSRYYDPQIGRFINADNIEVLQKDSDTIIEKNLYLYCLNNPVNLTDDDGEWPKWATKLVIGTAVIAAAAVLTVATAGTGTALACFAVGALKGAVVGAAVGAATGAATGAVTHRVINGTWKGAGKAALEGAADGYMTGAITGFISGGLSSNACFVAGTVVLTSAGHQAIETIKAGDMVWATDPETGETALKPVVRTFVNEATELVHVTVANEEIICTNEHPFYSPVKGWVAACDLRAGDILVLVSGEYVTVEKIQHEILDVPITVYNFEVADFHTYYVGTDSVLVHNLCKPKSSIKQNNSLVREANKLSGRAQKEVDSLVAEFLRGNTNPGVGTKHLAGNIYYLRGRNGARVFYRVVDGTMDILGKATKGNEQVVINLIKKTFLNA